MVLGLLFESNIGERMKIKDKLKTEKQKTTMLQTRIDKDLYAAAKDIFDTKEITFRSFIETCIKEYLKELGIKK